MPSPAATSTKSAARPSNQPVADALKNVLADSYALYLKTQNFHWNVTGPNFHGLHALFMAQYTDLATAIDELAERIRALGVKAPGGFKAYAQASRIQDGDENADAMTMVRTLRDDQRAISKTLAEAMEIAEEAGDEVTIDMIIGRLTVHDKNAWMLESILQ